VKINQNATIRAGRFPEQAQRTVAVGASRFAFTHVAKGSVLINGMPLEAGDAAAWRGEGELQVETTSKSEVLFFDLG
jgi:redox-sensitive bicupin YhaK (pirin superfamily)